MRSASLGAQLPEYLPADAITAKLRYSLRSYRVSVVADAPFSGDAVKSQAETTRILRAFFSTLDADKEHTVAIYLNQRNRLIAIKLQHTGTLDRAMVEPRDTLRDALLLGAAAVILSHNHPSGDPTPSAEDCDFTGRMRQAAAVVGVRLLDHVIIGAPGRMVSLRANGLFF